MSLCTSDLNMTELSYSLLGSTSGLKTRKCRVFVFCSVPFHLTMQTYLIIFIVHKKFVVDWSFVRAPQGLPKQQNVKIVPVSVWTWDIKWIVDVACRVMPQPSSLVDLRPKGLKTGSYVTHWRALQQHWDICDTFEGIIITLGHIWYMWGHYNNTGTYVSHVRALQQHWDICVTCEGITTTLGHMCHTWGHYNNTGTYVSHVRALQQHWDICVTCEGITTTLGHVSHVRALQQH